MFYCTLRSISFSKKTPNEIYKDSIKKNIKYELVAVEQRPKGGEQQWLSGLVKDAEVELPAADRRMVDSETSRCDNWSTVEHLFQRRNVTVKISGHDFGAVRQNFRVDSGKKN